MRIIEIKNCEILSGRVSKVFLNLDSVSSVQEHSNKTHISIRADGFFYTTDQYTLESFAKLLGGEPESKPSTPIQSTGNNNKPNHQNKRR